ncbi:MAG: hypothetical protein NTY67_12895 [Cyanobacteria bacterium]|nr:hypothetical protein [Cyanobacteriota bacterium]
MSGAQPSKSRFPLTIPWHGLIQSSWWLLILVISASFVLLGWIGWPGLHWDAALYATPVLNVGRSEGWLIDDFPLIALINTDRSYHAHGVLPVLVFGALFKAKTYASLLFLQGLVNALTFGVYSLLFRLALKRQGFWSLPASLALGVMAGIAAVALQGRPEHLIPLILIAPFWAFFKGATRSACFYIAAIVTGVVFVTSPLPGLMLAIFCSLGLGYVLPARSLAAWKYLITFASIAAAVSVLIITLFCPFSFFDWFRFTVPIQGSGQLSVNFIPAEPLTAA